MTPTILLSCLQMVLQILEVLSNLLNLVFLVTQAMVVMLIGVCPFHPFHSTSKNYKRRVGQCYFAQQHYLLVTRLSKLSDHGELLVLRSTVELVKSKVFILDLTTRHRQSTSSLRVSLHIEQYGNADAYPFNRGRMKID